MCTCAECARTATDVFHSWWKTFVMFARILRTYKTFRYVPGIRNENGMLFPFNLFIYFLIFVHNEVQSLLFFFLSIEGRSFLLFGFYILQTKQVISQIFFSSFIEKHWAFKRYAKRTDFSAITLNGSSPLCALSVLQVRFCLCSLCLLSQPKF